MEGIIGDAKSPDTTLEMSSDGSDGAPSELPSEKTASVATPADSV